MTVLTWFGVVAGALVLAALAYQGVGSALDARRLPPPGRLVDVGGHRLHLATAGEGQPVVIFESGIGASSLNWWRVQRAVAEFTSACVYDRSGYGWSDLSPRTPTAGEACDQLERALESAGLAPPFVLVGHSFGGYVLQIFAARHPASVAGLVLADSITWPEWRAPGRAQSRALAGGALFARIGAVVAALGVVRFALNRLQAGSTGMPKAVLGAFGSAATGVVTRIVGEVAKMPPETWPAIRAHWSRPKSFRAIARHLLALPRGAGEVEAALTGVTRWPFPVVVLTSGAATPSQIALQRQLADLSDHGRQLVVRASHWIHLDEPALIVKVIRDVVEQVRTDGAKGRTSAPPTRRADL
jgi:pimeloyl-ACP methyl ester carboxylesterase